MNRPFLAVVLVFTLAVAVVPQNRSQRLKTVSVSVPHLAASDGERVTGFEFSITGGMVQSISNLPRGWFIDVDNDPSWRTQVKGNIRVGAAALDQQEFQQIQLTVEQDETYLKFAISGTVSLTKDFEKDHLVRLSTRDFSVRAE